MPLLELSDIQGRGHNLLRLLRTAMTPTPAPWTARLRLSLALNKPTGQAKRNSQCDIRPQRKGTFSVQVRRGVEGRKIVWRLGTNHSLECEAQAGYLIVLAKSGQQR